MESKSLTRWLLAWQDELRPGNGFGLRWPDDVKGKDAKRGYGVLSFLAAHDVDPFTCTPDEVAGWVAYVARQHRPTFNRRMRAARSFFDAGIRLGFRGGENPIPEPTREHQPVLDPDELEELFWTAFDIRDGTPCLSGIVALSMAGLLTEEISRFDCGHAEPLAGGERMIRLHVYGTRRRVLDLPQALGDLLATSLDALHGSPVWWGPICPSPFDPTKPVDASNLGARFSDSMRALVGYDLSPRLITHSVAALAVQLGCSEADTANWRGFEGRRKNYTEATWRSPGITPRPVMATVFDALVPRWGLYRAGLADLASLLDEQQRMRSRFDDVVEARGQA